MFAEATLKGIVDERICRYDNATYFRLEVAARPRKAGEPVHCDLAEERIAFHAASIASRPVRFSLSYATAARDG